MKQQRAASALGILIIVIAGLVVARRFARRATPGARGALAARSAEAVKAPPALSASTALPVPPTPLRVLPPYVDTDAKTLPEQREALFSNMKNQLELPAGALDKIEAIFNASGRISQG